MLEVKELRLQEFFDKLIANTNPQMKSLITNQQNKKKLVAIYYFLMRSNNKFINSIKTEVRFLLSASGTLASAIETLANVRLTIRRKTIQKHKHQLASSYEQTVKDYIIENVIFLYIL